MKVTFLATALCALLTTTVVYADVSGNTSSSGTDSSSMPAPAVSGSPSTAPADSTTTPGAPATSGLMSGNAAPAPSNQ